MLAGAEATLRLLKAAFEKFGIESLDPTGQPFDPQYHEAMSMQPAPGAAPGSVLAVMQKGYRLNERLLRPARGSPAARFLDYPPGMATGAGFGGALRDLLGGLMPLSVRELDRELRDRLAKAVVERNEYGFDPYGFEPEAARAFYLPGALLLGAVIAAILAIFHRLRRSRRHY